jgi:hypothetical protein
MRQTIEGMALLFDPAAAGDLEATIQFEISGAEPGVYRLRISDGTCTFGTGQSVEPTLTIATPSEVWARVSSREISGRDALLDGLYEVRGDASLLARLSLRGSCCGSGLWSAWTSPPACVSRSPWRRFSPPITPCPAE